MSLYMLLAFQPLVTGLALFFTGLGTKSTNQTESESLAGTVRQAAGLTLFLSYLPVLVLAHGVHEAAGDSVWFLILLGAFGAHMVAGIVWDVLRVHWRKWNPCSALQRAWFQAAPFLVAIAVPLFLWTLPWVISLIVSWASTLRWYM